MSGTNPNTSQFQIPKDTLHTQNVEVKQKLTGTASATTQLTLQQLVVEVVPPASGVQTYKLPPLHTWKGDYFTAYCKTSAPGGETKFVLAEDGSDAVGDNISTTGDMVHGRNVQGEYFLLIKETTT